MKEKISGRNCISLEIDPNAVIEDPNSETSVIDTLATPDLFFMPATKDRTQGTLKVGEKLRERGHHDLPTIYFSPNLTQTLFEMTHYVKDPETGKPVDKDDHMMENLYRAVLSGLDYVTPSDEDKLPLRPEYSRHNAIHLSPYTHA